MRPEITRMNLYATININANRVFNQYKNSIGIIKIILKSNQIIGGKSDGQPRIGDCILVNFINLSWS